MQADATMVQCRYNSTVHLLKVLSFTTLVLFTHSSVQ